MSSSLGTEEASLLIEFELQVRINLFQRRIGQLTKHRRTTTVIGRRWDVSLPGSMGSRLDRMIVIDPIIPSFSSSLSIVILAVCTCCRVSRFIQGRGERRRRKDICVGAWGDSEISTCSAYRNIM